MLENYHANVLAVMMIDSCKNHNRLIDFKCQSLSVSEKRRG